MRTFNLMIWHSRCPFFIAQKSVILKVIKMTMTMMTDDSNDDDNDEDDDDRNDDDNEDDNDDEKDDNGNADASIGALEVKTKMSAIIPLIARVFFPLLS